MHSSLFDRYRVFETDELAVIDLFGSIARPFRAVFDAVRAAPDSASGAAIDLEQHARALAASLVGAEPAQVMFGRNTSEALSLCYWIADVQRGNVVTTDAEYRSVPRIFREHRDHGNTARLDPHTTWADAVIDEFAGQRSPLLARRETGVSVLHVRFLHDYDVDRIASAVDRNTRLVVVSHVVRSNGRIVAVDELARQVKARNPDAFVAIDGAQALGALPHIDFSALERAGVDFYVATAHKTLGSYPLGILYMSARAVSRIDRLARRRDDEQVILRGMVPRCHGIAPTIAVDLHRNRYVSLVTAIQTLRRGGFNAGADFTARAAHLGRLKAAFIAGLRAREIEILSPDDPVHSASMVSFRDRVDSAALVATLQRHHALCSYVEELDAIRVCFDVTTTAEHIEQFMARLDRVRFYRPRSACSGPAVTVGST